MGKQLNLENLRFGRLLVTALVRRGERGRKHWLCTCDCGGTKIVETYNLRSGKVQSCGCKHVEHASLVNRTHGMTGTKTHKIWCSMRARCSTASATGYKNYGGRGITVCRRWTKFENFLADMGPCPDGGSIERVDVHKGYKPSNCRWAPMVEQGRNTTRSVTVVFNGKTVLARDAAEANGILASTFKARLYKYGWAVEEACGIAERKKK